jgi:hypothetical protein
MRAWLLSWGTERELRLPQSGCSILTGRIQPPRLRSATGADSDFKLPGHRRFYLLQIKELESSYRAAVWHGSCFSTTASISQLSGLIQYRIGFRCGEDL